MKLTREGKNGVLVASKKNDEVPAANLNGQERQSGIPRLDEVLSKSMSGYVGSQHRYGCTVKGGSGGHLVLEDFEVGNWRETQMKTNSGQRINGGLDLFWAVAGILS